jgi:hypothetical protein
VAQKTEGLVLSDSLGFHVGTGVPFTV